MDRSTRWSREAGRSRIRRELRPSRAASTIAFLLLLGIPGLLARPAMAQSPSPPAAVDTATAGFRDLGAGRLPEDAARAEGEARSDAGADASLSPEDAAAPRSLKTYRHREGLDEIFALPTTPGAPWVGDLGSRFDPTRAVFLRRFRIADVVERALDRSLPARVRRASARRLLVALERLAEEHRAHEPELPDGGGAAEPEWPAPFERERRAIERVLRTEDRVAVAVHVAQARALLARRAPGPLPEALVDHRDHYRALVADGVLDISIIIGNAYDGSVDRYRSRELLEAFLRELERRAFVPVVDGEGDGNLLERSEEPTIDRERSVEFLGSPVRVRVRLTGGTLDPAHIRHNWIHCSHAFSHADIVLYHGHSNRGAAYSVERDGTGRARFDLGDPEDLRRTFPALGTRPVQLVVLQSCSSFDHYCRPLRRALEDEFAARPGRLGLVGTADKAYFDDMVPRFVALLDDLLAARPPSEILAHLDATRPRTYTPPMVARGFLQPVDTFILPVDAAGVPREHVTAWEERPAREGSIIVGTCAPVGEGAAGAEAVERLGTGIFPQDAPGEIVQVARAGALAYGLTADGRALIVGARTAGNPVPAFPDGVVRDDRTTLPRFRQIVSLDGGRKLTLVDADGRVWVAHRDGTTVRPSPFDPDGDEPPLAAIGRSVEGTFVALDLEGAPLVREPSPGRWRAAEAGEMVLAADFPPHLLGIGASGVLVRARGGEVVPLPEDAAKETPRPETESSGTVPPEMVPSEVVPSEVVPPSTVTP